jgi:HlyD family secretion protein
VLFILPAFLLTRPKKPEYITTQVTRGVLTQTVEAVGTVTSEKDLELQFRSAGIVQTVDVKEGTHVRAGQRLASLRAGGIAASIASAQASLAEANANLQELLEGTRPEDLAVEEASLENKKAQLQAAKESLATATENERSSQLRLDSLNAEAEITKSNEVSTVGSFLSQKISTADLSITSGQDVFLNNDLQDAIVRGYVGDYQTMQNQMNAVRSSLTAALNASTSITDTNSAISVLRQARAAVAEAVIVLDKGVRILANPSLEGSISLSNLTSYRSSLATYRGDVQTVQRDIDDEISDLQATPATLQTRISAEQSNLASARGARQKAQSDILTYETAVRIQEAQLALKKAGARQTDIDAAKARVNAARASVARAVADYADTLISAPTSGVITKVDVKAGEFTPSGAAITMMGDSPYRIEMFVSEIDVPKLQVSQSGSITLDAFRRTPFALRVADIDAGATDTDGVPKYKVKLDFLTVPEGLRIGMTGDASIVTGQRNDVLSVPRRAILDSTTDSGSVVRVLKNGTVEERRVVMGMEGGNGDAEVLSGLEEGETVVVLQK